MKIKKDIIYKLVFATLLVAPLFITSVEFNIVLISFVSAFVLFNTNHKYSKALVTLVFPLIVIFLVAIFSSFFFPSTLYDVTKDVMFLIKPILYIFLGYFFIFKIKDKEFIFKIILYLGVAFAVLHLFNVIYYLSGNEFNINSIRSYAGRDNTLEIFALAIILAKKERSLINFNLKYRKAILVLLFCSFVFYFSRTVTVSVIILTLAINGYLAITRKGLMYMLGFLVLTSLFYTYLFSIDIKRGAIGIEGFLYKLKIAPEEIFDSKINVNDHRDLWDHWRAYEAQKAFNQIEDTPMHIGLVMGKGVGSLVDLGFVAPLNEEGMQYITTLHNGYSFITFKSGFIGLISYLTFLLILYIQVYNKNKELKLKIINGLLSGLAVYYLFTTLIVTGIYNPSDFSGIILGGLYYLKHYYKLEANLIPN